MLNILKPFHPRTLTVPRAVHMCLRHVFWPRVRGMEISQPLSDNELAEVMKSNNMEAPQPHPWIQKATMRGAPRGHIWVTFQTYI